MIFNLLILSTGENEGVLRVLRNRLIFILKCFIHEVEAYSENKEVELFSLSLAQIQIILELSSSCTSCGLICGFVLFSSGPASKQILPGLLSLDLYLSTCSLLVYSHKTNIPFFLSIYHFEISPLCLAPIFTFSKSK